MDVEEYKRLKAKIEEHKDKAAKNAAKKEALEERLLKEYNLKPEDIGTKLDELREELTKLDADITKRMDKAQKAIEEYENA